MAWEGQYEMYEDVLYVITTQIAETEKLESRGWQEGDGRLRDAFETRMRYLNNRKRVVSSYLNCMEDFKQNKHPELFDQSKLDAPKTSDEPSKKSADELVPTESK